jgi:hypothetical protein
MSLAQLYLPPLLGMVALSYLVALAILVSRCGDLLSGRRSLAYYQDWDGSGASAAVMRPTRQLANLFEFPVLFYAAVAMIVACGLRDAWLPGLCRAYVVLRGLHALVHIAYNRLWLRTPLFMAGQFVLLALWVRFAVLALA